MSMYFVSQPKPFQHDFLVEIEAIFFPPGYLTFLQQFGAGTYRGWIYVHLPDSEVLKPFVEYDLWEHNEGSPITQQQIGECIVIGTTIDGDFLAVHPEVDQLLWLPRHADHVLTVQKSGVEDDEIFTVVLDNLYYQVYGEAQEGPMYYEPCSDSQNYHFLRLPPKEEGPTLQELAKMFKAAFLPDLIMENSYICKFFYQMLGGYVTFNYAYGQEIAIKYEQDKQQLYNDIEEWLVTKGSENI